METDTPLLESGYQKLEFDTALEFICWFDPYINDGSTKLYKWQAEELMKVSSAEASSQKPFRYALCAANGSGKDAYFIAPLVVWFICCNIKARVVITSASGVQLSNQTENYISQIANHVNAWSQEKFGADIIKVNKRHIYCHLTGSRVELFATDEEGKAEGYHPEPVPGAKLMLIANEAKSIDPGIFRAFSRCTGFTHYLMVSSPGEPRGDFFRAFTAWAPNRRTVNYFDCPHLSADMFEADRKELGEHSPLFRSKWLALFTNIGGRFVVSQEHLDNLKLACEFDKIKKFGSELRVGIDIALSLAGDESVISVFRGNQQIKQLTCRIQDATLLADFISAGLVTLKIPKNHEHIYADDCGVGRAVIDILRRKGWSIRRVMNNSPAKNKDQFRNRGAELWYKFSRLVEEKAVILLPDEILFEQIASRKYKETASGIDKLQLQGKPEMIAEGIKSPDRADAAVLALTGINLEEWLQKIEEVQMPKIRLSHEDMLAALEDSLYESLNSRKTSKRAFGSVDKLMNRKQLTNSKWL